MIRDSRREIRHGKSEGLWCGWDDMAGWMNLPAFIYASRASHLPGLDRVDLELFILSGRRNDSDICRNQQ